MDEQSLNLQPDPMTSTEIEPGTDAPDPALAAAPVPTFAPPVPQSATPSVAPAMTPVPPPVAQPTSVSTGQLTVNYTMIALVFLGVGILLGRLIFGGTGSGGVDEATLRTIINQAIAQVGGSTDQSQAKLTDDDPYFGPVNAPVTIVEFSDFNCGFCTRFATETLPKLRDTYGENIRYVYRDMPIIGGQVSVESAIAASCANDQGKFWDFHNLLFTNAQARSHDAYVNFASELGLDTNVYSACLNDTDKSKSNEVTLDLLDGQALDIRGTPAFYVNGRFISGAQPFEVFQLVINSELSKAGIQPPA